MQNYKNNKRYKNILGNDPIFVVLLLICALLTVVLLTGVVVKIRSVEKKPLMRVIGPAVLQYEDGTNYIIKLIYRKEDISPSNVRN
jgi:hypothetical protein